MRSSIAGTTCGLELARVDAADVGPAPFDRRVPALVLELAQLLDRDVLVGVRVVLGDARRRPSVRARVAAASGAAVSRARRSGLVTIASTPSTASHDGEALAPAPLRASVSPGSAGPRLSPDAMRTGSACRMRSSSIAAEATSSAGRAPLAASTVESSRGSPSSASSSATAAAGSATLIVAMPIARAGFRFTPRSSRKTVAAGSTSSRAHDELVDARVGLAEPLDRRFDHDVEQVESSGRVVPFADVLTRRARRASCS